MNDEIKAGMIDTGETERDMERMRLESEIRTLVSKLDAPTSDIGDWKVVKCYEAKLLGKELPYDLEALMTERQKVRDKINEIQKQLEEI